MRILIYSDNYYPKPIGTAPLITELAEGLAAGDHQVRVITALPGHPEHVVRAEAQSRLYATEEHNGVTIHRCLGRAHRQPGLAGRLGVGASLLTLGLGAALRGWRPDIILNSSPALPTGLPVALLKTLFRCPVVNLQDLLSETAIAETAMPTGLLTKPGAHLAERLELACRKATRTGAIAQGFRHHWLAQGVPDRNRGPISNRVDVDFITPRPQASSKFRRRHGLYDKFVVLYTGNIAATQGVKTALQAAQHLSAYPAIQLVIVGQGKQLKALESLRQELGLTNVSLLPFGPRTELPDLLAGADVGLILQKHDGADFNLLAKTEVLLASGRPILASVPTHGSTAQTITASGGGRVVAPEDPAALAQGILDLYHDPAQAKSLARRGRQYALKHFSAKGAIDRNVTLFYALATR